MNGTFASRKCWILCFKNRAGEICNGTLHITIQFSTDRASFLGEYKRAAHQITYNACDQYGKYPPADQLYTSEIWFKTRIILSETGYTSVQRKHNVENLQAAAVAYSYLLAESDNMIDSLIIHRQIDHKEEIKQGLNLGLWTTDARSADFESANTKKRSWSVFKYMDSSRSASETAFIPSTIGVSNWKSLIPSYSSKLYNKSNCTIGALEQVNAYRRGASIYQSWSPYGAVTTSHKTGNTFTALHDIRRNKNSLWGFSQK